MKDEGRSQCLDAFTVALNQACEGGEKRWYASTLELQLASLEFCRACRSVPTLHVRVNPESPTSLWSSSTAYTVRIGSWVFGSSTRVPAVRAGSLTWNLPIDALLYTVSSELWKWSDFVDLQGPILADGLASVDWPKGLKTLVLSTFLECPVEAVSWPALLQSLAFGKSFNENISGVSWPPSLKHLSFGFCFNQPIAGVVWPAGLERLSFQGRFNQPILGVAWPASLQQLSFRGNFDQPIAGVTWPASLLQLSFAGCFNQPIAEVVWPTRLQKLTLVCSFNQPLGEVSWPASLQQLTFGFDFNQAIDEVTWPTSLQQLTFGSEMDQPITGVTWPASLRQLSFGKKFNQSIAGVAWPASLEKLCFGDDFFGSTFDQPLAGVVWPASPRTRALVPQILHSVLFSKPFLTRLCLPTPAAYSRQMASMAIKDPDQVDKSSTPTLSAFVMRSTGDQELAILMHNIALCCKSITRAVRKAGIAGLYGLAGTDNSSGDHVKKLDILSNDIMINALTESHMCAVLVSEENEEPIIIEDSKSGKYCVAFDPLDGSSNIDCNVSTGTIFAVYDKKSVAGYCMYGSATELVLTFYGSGVHRFTLDPSLGEFIHIAADVKIPSKPKNIYSCNEGNFDSWDEEIKRAVMGFKTDSPPWAQRYVGSMVSDVHRTLLYGGLFLYPADKKSTKGKLRVLYEGFPMALIIEQAGGMASTGMFNGSIGRVLEIAPKDIHERCPIIIGNPHMVERVLDEYKKA
eukprot:g7883.t1